MESQSFAVAMIQDIPDTGTVGIQGLEVAHDLADGIDDGKSIGIFADNAGNLAYLGLIDHADQKVCLPAGIHALGRNQSRGVMGLFDDLLRDLSGIIGDDLKPDSFTTAFDPAFHQSGCCKTVKDAQDHRLHLIAEHEVAGDCNADIHDKGHAVNALIRVLVMDQSRYEIHTAGIGTGPGQNGAVESMDDTGHQRSQDLAGSVFRGIGKQTQIHMVQNEQRHGKSNNINHAAQSDGFAAFEVTQSRQRNIDQQAQRTYTDAEYVLDDGANAVYAGWRKLIREDKQLIIHGTNEADSHDHEVSQKLFIPGHDRFS